MKKLTKILLINWLFFSKQLIEVGDINFLTGKNKAGKSTVIDALQIVLLGELNERNFNKAANEKSQRTLAGYLRAGNDDNNPKSRRGKDFSSYIACQFLDDQTGAQFVSGIIFDCRNDGSMREQFFIYNGVIPEHCFLVDGLTMDIAALRGYLRTLPDARETFYDSNKRYREDLLAKWNVHNEQVFRMLKKAVSYKPISDIQMFITENICDIPEKPDIESMQQNIRDYKRHEALAQRQEEKLTRLVAINRLHREMQASVDRLRIQRFIVLWAQINDLNQQIEKDTVSRHDCLEGIESSQKKYEEQGILITNNDSRKNELIADRANSDVYKEETRLRGQKSQLEQERRSLMEQLNAMALEIKREAQQLSNLCDDISSWQDSEPIRQLKAAAAELQNICGSLTSCTTEIFAGALSPFESAQESVQSFSACLRSTAYQLGEQMNRLHLEMDQSSAILERLKNNIKDYPKALLTLKEQLEQELSAISGRPVAVEILADLLEIAEGQESWRGAVEGYLNTQKLYLLVEPVIYEDALMIFDGLKREFGNQSFGLVDIGKLREKEKLSPLGESLAAIIQTDNQLARSYIDYLLGGVVRCTHTSQLREHRTAITVEGMVYHGYVARPIPKHIMENAFIGRKAVALRIARLSETISELQREIEAWSPVYTKLDGYKNKEYMFTMRFVQEAEQKQADYLRGLEIMKELEHIDEKLSHLDLFWLSKIEQEIKQLEQEIISIRKKQEDTVREKAVFEERLRVLDFETLPDKYQQLTEKEDRLGEDFSQQFQESTGLPRYAQELGRLKRHAVVAKNFSDHMPQTYNEVENSKSKLFGARSEYVREFQPCSFKPEAMDNDEFETERKLLEESELPNYREKIMKARESALEQFQNDFLAKLKSSIDQVQEQVKNLNRALEGASFGTDKYRFIVGRNPDEADYYDMIMAPELMEGDGGLFAMPFQQKYGTLIEDLFSKIATSDDTQLNARKQSELQKNIERYTDFRSYLKFDMETTDMNGSKYLLSQTMSTNSGGETQTPFYIAVLASFAQLYRTSDTSSFGNTVRLVVFDEAFNKMDSDRIIESVRLLRKMRLQAIICTPPDKVPDIMPEADNTLMSINERYTMKILPYSKEIADIWSGN